MIHYHGEELIEAIRKDRNTFFEITHKSPRIIYMRDEAYAELKEFITQISGKIIKPNRLFEMEIKPWEINEDTIISYKGFYLE